jgi:hypothetical protein
MRLVSHNAKTNRRGYVLVVTLALLVVSAAVMVGVARLAIRESSLARQAADDLQRRWAVTSIRIAVLPGAEAVLQAAEASFHRPVPVFVSSLALGGQRFDVVVSDEQAKANVNVMLDRSPHRAAANAAVEARLRELLRGAVAARLKLRPEPPAVRALTTQPATRPTTRPMLVMQLSSFGQIFDSVQPQDLINLRYATISPASLLTCWGNGAINVRRASEASMKAIVSPPMSSLEVSRLIDARGAIFKGGAGLPPSQPLTQSQPRGPLPADPARRLLAQGNIQPNAATRMTLSSSCHSLWIVAQ